MHTHHTLTETHPLARLDRARHTVTRRAATRWRALHTRTRRIVISLLAIALTFGGIFAVSPAYGAETVSYIDSGAVSRSVSATDFVTLKNHTYLDGWYYCNSSGEVTATQWVWFKTVNLIVGDKCSLTVNSATSNGYESGIEVGGGTLNIYGQTGNSGRITFNSTGYGAGIELEDGTLNIYGGSVYGYAKNTSAGIGSVAGVSGWNNTIRIFNRANVFARGGAGSAGYGGGAGIGSGGSGDSTRLLPGNIYISTDGLVHALGSPDNAIFYGGRHIGGGGSKLPPTQTVATATLSKPTVSPAGAGSVRLSLASGENVENYSNLKNTAGPIAVGSKATWIATPNVGYRAVSGVGNDVPMKKLGDTFRHDVSSSASPQSATITFIAVPTITLAASPASKQTRPGDVTLTATAKVGTTAVSGVSLPFFVNGAQVGAAVTNAQGVATFKVASPAIGTYSYQVKYKGLTGTYDPADSNLISGYTVVPSPDTVPLELTGLSAQHTYGDGPLAIGTTGGSGTGAVTLTSSNPEVASLSDATPAGAATLTLNRAGTFTLTQTKAQDANYAEQTKTTQVTVVEATPTAVLTRTGGNSFEEPLDLTMQVTRVGSGSTPQGSVQFYMKSDKLGGPLPLVDNGDGTASVSLTNIPLKFLGSENVRAVYLGEEGKYKSVTRSEDWYLGKNFCAVSVPEEPAG